MDQQCFLCMPAPLGGGEPLWYRAHRGRIARCLISYKCPIVCNLWRPLDEVYNMPIASWGHNNFRYEPQSHNTDKICCCCSLAELNISFFLLKQESPRCTSFCSLTIFLYSTKIGNSGLIPFLSIIGICTALSSRNGGIAGGLRFWEKWIDLFWALVACVTFFGSKRPLKNITKGRQLQSRSTFLSLQNAQEKWIFIDFPHPVLHGYVFYIWLVSYFLLTSACICCTYAGIVQNDVFAFFDCDATFAPFLGLRLPP